MTPDLIFRLSNFGALAGWLALNFAGRMRYVATALCKFVLPGLLACVYFLLILTLWRGHAGGFGSVTAVQQLFLHPWLVTAGWVHYLAFDLFLGAWQVRDAERSAVRHWLTIPCLLLTFLFGPIGFLLYLVLKGYRATSRGELR